MPNALNARPSKYARHFLELKGRRSAPVSGQSSILFIQNTVGTGCRNLRHLCNAEKLHYASGAWPLAKAESIVDPSREHGIVRLAGG